MTEQAKRFNKGKPKLSYMLDFPNAIESHARICEGGAKEYGRDNWKRGLPFRDVLDSALRHLLAFAKGQDRDEKSGELHLGHAMWNVMAIIEYMQTHPEMDDRNTVPAFIVPAKGSVELKASISVEEDSDPNCETCKHLSGEDNEGPCKNCMFTWHQVPPKPNWEPKEDA